MTQQGSEAARQLASMRRLYKKTCPVCGSEFEGIARRVYDKPACQVRAYRQRRKQAERSRPPLGPSTPSR